MFQFHPRTTISISGGTGSGKSRLLFRILKQQKQLFMKPPSKIMYCYGIYQELFEEMEDELTNITFHQGLPTFEEVKEFTNGSPNTLICIDDLMESVVKNTDIERLFSQGAHHLDTTIVYINQNLFCQGKHARTISLNTHYIILLRSPRQASQIQYLGRQIMPNNPKAVVESYEDCMKTPFGYLIINLSPYANEDERLITRIFPENGDPIVYIPM